MTKRVEVGRRNKTHQPTNANFNLFVIEIIFVFFPTKVSVAMCPKFTLDLSVNGAI